MALETLVFPLENVDSDDDKCLYCLLVEKFDWRGGNKMKENSIYYIYTHKLACFGFDFLFLYTWNTPIVVITKASQVRQVEYIMMTSSVQQKQSRLNIEVVNKIVPANQTSSSDFLFLFYSVVDFVLRTELKNEVLYVEWEISTEW